MIAAHADARREPGRVGDALRASGYQSRGRQGGGLRHEVVQVVGGGQIEFAQLVGCVCDPALFESGLLFVHHKGGGGDEEVLHRPSEVASDGRS
jgi:hypothetical protein